LVKPKKEAFSARQLQILLTGFPSSRRYWVGFSGGADSTALLVAMNELAPQLPAKLHAVHFNHGLQPAAAHWQAHCQFFCEQRGIPFHVRQLELDVARGQSPEEQARHHRYAAMEQLLDQGDTYLTAHHADDNAETFFLNLMRGSGMDGLAAIPPIRKLGKGWVARPLLEWRRSELESFLRLQGIAWLEDPSNLNTAYDRNYLRHQLFPQLDLRWPGAIGRLNQTAAHARDFAALLTSLLTAQHGSLMLDNYTLALEPFLGLERELQAMLIRKWLRDQDIVSPPKPKLHEFLRQINGSARADRQPELRWAGNLIKRHGGLLWLHDISCPAVCPSRAWRDGLNLDLGKDFGHLRLSGNLSDVPPGWEVAPLRRGARIVLNQRGPRRKLAELMRECGLPPWLRAAIPVLYWRGEAAAVGDCLLSSAMQQFLAQNAAEFDWEPNHPLLRKLQSVSVHSLSAAESTDET
jgi:tRNA(Ile)-lysidine synthase